MSITQKQLFYGAYRDAGLVPLEQTGLNADQEEEARVTYNRMVDGWRLNGLLVSHTARTTFALVSGTGDYTFGPAGTSGITTRPVRITRCSLLNTHITPNAEYHLEPLTEQDWQRWRMKGLQITWPSSFYYEPAGTLGILHLLYVPSESNSCVVYLEEPLSQIAVAAGSPPNYAAVDIEFSPGYEEAIESNLAKTLAARNGGNISPLTLQTAALSLRRLKIANFKSTTRDSDYPSRGPAYHDGYGNRRA